MFESNCRVIILAILQTMEKKEFRVLIKHYYLKSKTTKEAIKNLDKYCGTSAPSNTTVKRWMQEFKFGRTREFDKSVGCQRKNNLFGKNPIHSST